ncbi:MAG: N-formylglutamate amidohydrolase [Planctomycetota bacterium]
MRKRQRPTALVISCEHGGNDIPPAFASLFAGKERRARVASHRGWDPGAAELAADIVMALGVPSHVCRTTRLLIEVNRSLHHRRLFSDLSRDLPEAQRSALIEQIWRPYREAVTREIAAHVAAGRDVLHVLVHSFTPELDGEVRNADVALLYDPSRSREVMWVEHWRPLLQAADERLRIRRNYPYRGTADGFEVALRRQFADPHYSGITIEVNQAFPLGRARRWREVRATIVATIEQLAELAATGSAR